MLKHITGIVAIALLMLAAPIAAAQTPQKPRAQTQTAQSQKQKLQAQTARPKMQMAQRLRGGIRSGQLTPAELGKLRQSLKTFRAEVKQLRSSGTLSREDRVALRRQWRQISRIVFLAKHNGIRRGGR